MQRHMQRLSSRGFALWTAAARPAAITLELIAAGPRGPVYQVAAQLGKRELVHWAWVPPSPWLVVHSRALASSAAEAVEDSMPTQAEQALEPRAAEPAAVQPAAADESADTAAAEQPAKRSRRRRRRADTPLPPVAPVTPAEGLGTASDGSDDAALQGRRIGLPARILEDDAHPIRDRHLTPAAWFVLTRLRGAGHECYVVGGTVRDILLGGTPKDYDILTSGEPHQVRKLFNHCIVVGRSFPVCHVHTNGTVIEVSSFSTNASATTIPSDASSYLLGRHKHSKQPQQEGANKGKRRDDEGATWASARRENASRRDFTVNALLYDPFSRMLYDYVEGTADIDACLLRTISPPAVSFQQDPARMIRGVRLAARAGLEIEDQTAGALSELAHRLAGLPQGRLQMELTSLMSYGAAAGSLRLMWRFGILDLLLPHHVSYMRMQRIPRQAGRPRRRKPDLLFALLGALDEQVSPQTPVDPSAWVALLAAPLIVRAWQSLVRRRQSAAARLREQLAEAAPAALQDELEAGGLQASADDVNEVLGSTDYLEGRQEADSRENSSTGSISTAGALSDALSNETEDVSSDSGGGDSSNSSEEEEEDNGDQDSGSASEAETSALEAYAAIVEEVIDRLLQPLDVAMCSRLSLDAALLLALRPTSRQSAQLERLALQQLDLLGMQSPGATEGARRAAWPVASVAKPALDTSTVVLPSILPKAAADKAAALLLAEVELRGQELPWERSTQHQHRQHRHSRRVSSEEKLVLSILRDPRFEYGCLTDLKLYTAGS